MNDRWESQGLKLEESYVEGDDEQPDVYAIVCLPARKGYIGSTRITFAYRWRQHLQQLDANRHSCLELQFDYRQYGRLQDTFYLCILEVSPTPRAAERQWKQWWHSQGWLYNPDRYMR